ncbi:RpiB/LacA/LacB family sugar-phosphate isomerase [Candidatus Dependentiae bacterium]|nr:MAG: RpiB/LacA/LacB family sugar-phosphate isomerase [Candidatus Dependentiae bacterium]
MKIAIGADHHGLVGKEFIKEQITDVEWLDVGTLNEERTDYPIFAKKVSEALLSGQVQQGVLLCGTGVGMAIAANRFPKIYAGLAWNEEIARSAKEDDNVNVLVLPADYLSNDQMVTMVKAWRDAQFNEGRYAKRIAMIDD